MSNPHISRIGPCSDCKSVRPTWPTMTPRADDGWYCLACWTRFLGRTPRPEAPTKDNLMTITGGNAPFYISPSPRIDDHVAFYTEELKRLIHPSGVHSAVIKSTAEQAGLLSRVGSNIAADLSGFLRAHPPIASLVHAFDTHARGDPVKWFKTQTDFVFDYAARFTPLGIISCQAMKALDLLTSEQKSKGVGAFPVYQEWMRVTDGAFSSTKAAGSENVLDISGRSVTWRALCEVPPVSVAMRDIVKRMEKHSQNMSKEPVPATDAFPHLANAFVMARRDQSLHCLAFQCAVKFSLFVEETMAKYGVTEAIEARVAATASLGKRCNDHGKQTELALLSDSIERLTKCERHVIAHGVAVTPRDPSDGLVSSLGTLPGGGAPSGQAFTTSWPSSKDLDAWCEWVMTCRRRAREDTQSFMEECVTHRRPFLLLLRNVKVMGREKTSTHEFDGVLFEVCSNAVVSIIEIKSSPVELPTSHQQRDKFVKRLTLEFSKAGPISKSDEIVFLATVESLTVSSFRDFSENPVLRWLSVSWGELAPWKSCIRGSMSWFVVAEFGALLGESGYSTAASEDVNARALGVALSPSNVAVFSKKMFGMWKGRFQKEGMVEPVWFVDECVRMGGWNVYLMKFTDAVKE